MAGRAVRVDELARLRVDPAGDVLPEHPFAEVAEVVLRAPGQRLEGDADRGSWTRRRPASPRRAGVVWGPVSIIGRDFGCAAVSSLAQTGLAAHQFDGRSAVPTRLDLGVAGERTDGDEEAFSSRPATAPRKSRTAPTLTAPLYRLHWKYTGNDTSDSRHAPLPRRRSCPSRRRSRTRLPGGCAEPSVRSHPVIVAAGGLSAGLASRLPPPLPQRRLDGRPRLRIQTDRPVLVPGELGTVATGSGGSTWQISPPSRRSHRAAGGARTGGDLTTAAICAY